jgi:hypothetical protein
MFAMWSAHQHQPALVFSSLWLTVLLASQIKLPCTPDGMAAAAAANN